jgi:hypothetical protein
MGCGCAVSCVFVVLFLTFLVGCFLFVALRGWQGEALFDWFVAAFLVAAPVGRE